MDVAAVRAVLLVLVGFWGWMVLGLQAYHVRVCSCRGGAGEGGEVGLGCRVRDSLVVRGQCARQGMQSEVGPPTIAHSHNEPHRAVARGYPPDGHDCPTLTGLVD